MPAINTVGVMDREPATSAIVSSSVRMVAGRERGRARSISSSAAALPAQCEVRRGLLALDPDDDLFN